MPSNLKSEHSQLKYDNVKEFVEKIWDTGMVEAEGLAKVVNQINANSRSTDEAENYRCVVGYLEELKYAYSKAKKGYKVTLGAKNGIGADVNYIAKGQLKSVQIKYVTSDKTKKVRENIVKALKQLGGEGGEWPAVGALRKVRVKTSNQHELGDMTKQDQKAKLLEIISNNQHLHQHADKIKVELPVSKGSKDAWVHSFTRS